MTVPEQYGIGFEDVTLDQVKTLGFIGNQAGSGRTLTFLYAIFGQASTTVTGRRFRMQICRGTGTSIGSSNATLRKSPSYISDPFASVYRVNENGAPTGGSFEVLDEVNPSYESGLVYVPPERILKPIINGEEIFMLAAGGGGGQNPNVSFSMWWVEQ